MAAEERPTVPPGLDELRHDVIRLRWAEKGAYSRLLDEIRKYPDVSSAFDRWREAHERRVRAEELLGQVEQGGGQNP